MPAAVKAQRLDFHEKLIQKGKGAGADALLKRLKILHTKLKEYQQDSVDLKSLKSVEKELINPVILHHKDRGVKAYAACCLADILRLEAPDAPYDPDELRDIFQFFLVQITNLKQSPSAARAPIAPSKRGNDTQTTLTANTRITEIPYYTEYNYLIDSLVTIQSICIIIELPGADELISEYFRQVVETVRPDMTKHLSRNLASMLVDLVKESEAIPAEVIELVLSQFEHYGSKPDTPSFDLTVQVCNRTADKFQRPILAHFKEIQDQHGHDPSGSDLKTLAESHDLLKIIFRQAPDLLLNVIPMLEEDLQIADEPVLRQLSTETLGTMFTEQPTVGDNRIDFVRLYSGIWKVWLGRSADKVIAVRVAWIAAAGRVLVKRSELRKDIEKSFQERIEDPDERARAAVCETLGSLEYESALHLGSKLLRALGVRMNDKKASVREAAVTALGKLWTQSLPEIEVGDEDAIRLFAWIPCAMLRAFHRVVGQDAKNQITVAFRNHILPLPAKPEADVDSWVDRFLLVASFVLNPPPESDGETFEPLSDNTDIKTLDSMTGIVGYAKGTLPYRAFIDICEEWNGGDTEKEEASIKSSLNFIVETIARSHFGDSEKARKDLNQFAAANEPRLYKLFKALVDPQTSLRDMIKTKNEFLRRIEQHHESISATFTTLIDSVAWTVLNQSSIPTLIKTIQKGASEEDGDKSQLATHYLGLISKHCSPMFKSHVPHLVVIVNDKKNDSLVETGLEALAAVTKWEKASSPAQKSFLERVKHLALNGTPRQAKFATRFLVFCKDGNAAAELIESLWDEMPAATDAELLPLLRSASELALSAPQTFNAKGEEIASFILTDLVDRPSPSGDQEDDRWVDEASLEPLDLAKVYALRVLTHQCLGWGRDENAVELATPTFTLLSQILQRAGQATATSNEGGQAKVHLRLRATLCFIKLARVYDFDRTLTSVFSDIAFTIQDPIFKVRQHMLRKLSEALPPQRIMPRWNAIPFLTAADPESDIKTTARAIIASYIRIASRKRRVDERLDRIEMPFARLLYLLAVHPDTDWAADSESLRNNISFIELFVELVAHKDNVGLLYTIVTKLKTLRIAEEEFTAQKMDILVNGNGSGTLKDDDNDGNDEDDDIQSPTLNLYRLSEMAQIIISNRAHHHQWTLSSFPGKLKLPGDIFFNLPTLDAAQKVARKTFLPDDVAQIISAHKTKSSHSRRAAGDTSPRKRKAAAPKSASDKPKAPRKKRRTSGRHVDTEDEDSDEDSDEEDEDEDDEDEVSDEESASEEEEEEDDAPAVMGRGGRRNAKTKANKAVTKKKKVKRSPVKRSPAKRPAKKARAGSESSELSEMSE